MRQIPSSFAILMQSEEKCCLLLQTSFPLKSLVRIKLTCAGQETVRKEKLCSSLNEQQLGGVVVTVLDNSTSLCFAICHKVSINDMRVSNTNDSFQNNTQQKFAYSDRVRQTRSKASAAGQKGYPPFC